MLFLLAGTVTLTSALLAATNQLVLVAPAPAGRSCSSASSGPGVPRALSCSADIVRHCPTSPNGSDMCRSMTCKTCGLASWTGCGQHVVQVMAGVPEAKRCQGHPTQARAAGRLRARFFGRR